MAQLRLHHNITPRHMFQPSLITFKQVQLSRLECTRSKLCHLHDWLYLLYIILYMCFYTIQQRYVPPYTTGFYGWVRHVVDRDVSLRIWRNFSLGVVLDKTETLDMCCIDKDTAKQFIIFTFHWFTNDFTDARAKIQIISCADCRCVNL
jgi:hypothetical protein